MDSDTDDERPAWMDGFEGDGQRALDHRALSQVVMGAGGVAATPSEPSKAVGPYGGDVPSAASARLLAMGYDVNATRAARELYVGGVPADCGVAEVRRWFNRAAVLLEQRKTAAQFLADLGARGETDAELDAAKALLPVQRVWVSPDAQYAFAEFKTIETTSNVVLLSGVAFKGATLSLGRPKAFPAAWVGNPIFAPTVERVPASVLQGGYEGLLRALLPADPNLQDQQEEVDALEAELLGAGGDAAGTPPPDAGAPEAPPSTGAPVPADLMALNETDAGEFWAVKVGEDAVADARALGPEPRVFARGVDRWVEFGDPVPRVKLATLRGGGDALTEAEWAKLRPTLTMTEGDPTRELAETAPRRGPLPRARPRPQLEPSAPRKRQPPIPDAPPPKKHRQPKIDL